MPVPQPAGKRPAAAPPSTPRFPTPARKAPPKRPATPARRPGLFGWLRVHQVTAALVGGLLILAAVVTAAVAIRQDLGVTPRSKDPVVTFANGDDYVAINAAGFATVTLGANGASASISASGVAGAAQVSLGEVLKITNSDTSAYVLTFTLSGAISDDVDSLLMTFVNSVPTTMTWNAVTTGGTSNSIAIPASSSIDVSMLLVVEVDAVAGALGSPFTIQMNIVPA